MKYDLFLFDIDDTLFDFQTSERRAFYATIESFGIFENIELLFQRYKKESGLLWQEFERGLISKDFLKVERFRRAFTTHGCKIQFEKASELYLEILSETVILNHYAFEICKFLSQHGEVGIVTNGIEFVQRTRIERSSLAPFISFMTISETCSYAKPDVRFFEQVAQQSRKFQKEKSLVIGDRMETDIEGACNFGIDACLYNPNKKPYTHYLKPTYEIHHFSEVEDLIRNEKD